MKKSSGRFSLPELFLELSSLMASRSSGGQLFALGDHEEVLLRRALLENLQRVHQLTVVGDAAPLRRGIAKRQPGNSVAEETIDF